MNTLSRRQVLGAVAGAAMLTLGAAGWRAADAAAQPKAAIRPALAVTTTLAASAQWPQKLSANGNVAAWQEASIGAEVSGLRLTEVNVNVGDAVRRGQELARFSDVTVRADVAQAAAAVAETEAALAEARANADRARRLQDSGALSAQQISQYLTAERTAGARLESARATLANQQTRLQQTRLLAPDGGVISARLATVGTVVPAGQELFRLIRDSRIEWRAEVTAAELQRVRIGQKATVFAPGSGEVRGTVRMIAPTVDARTRLGVVYVDLPAGSGLKAGMFARGEFELGRSAALTLPQSAVVQREGFSYVYRVGADSKAVQTKVTVGRRLAERIEIVAGLDPAARVVATGAPFLTDGDLLRVVDKPEEPAQSRPVSHATPTHIKRS